MDRTQIIIVVAAGLMLVLSMQLGAGPASKGPPPDAPVAGQTATTPEAGSERTAPEKGSPAPAEAPRVVERELVQSELTNGAVRLAVTNEGGRVRSLELREFADRGGKDAGPVQLVT